MKGAKLVELTKHRIPTSPSSTSNTASKSTQKNKLSSKAKTIGHNKENLDSKTSTQDQTHKLDVSHPRLKDISNIVISKSSSSEEQCLAKSFSALSLINILDEANSNHLNQEILNFDNLEDKEILKRELEMKNRLIEKLMKENAIIREETQTILINIEEVKKHLNADIQNYNSKITELEQQVINLEVDNKLLREKIRQNNYEMSQEGNKQIRQLGEQVECYCKIAKNDMEELYSRFNEQVKCFVDTSRSQYESFVKKVQDQINPIKNGHLVDLKNKAQYLKKSETLQSNQNAHTKNGLSLDQLFTMEGLVTQSVTSLPSSGREDYNTQRALYLKRNLTDLSSNPKKLANNYEKIDESPEFSSIKKGSSFPNKKFGQIDQKRRTADCEKPFVKQKNMRLSLGGLSLSKSATKNRTPFGQLSNEKN